MLHIINLIAVIFYFQRYLNPVPTSTAHFSNIVFQTRRSKISILKVRPLPFKRKFDFFELIDWKICKKISIPTAHLRTFNYRSLQIFRSMVGATFLLQSGIVFFHTTACTNKSSNCRASRPFPAQWDPNVISTIHERSYSFLGARIISLLFKCTSNRSISRSNKPLKFLITPLRQNLSPPFVTPWRLLSRVK